MYFAEQKDKLCFDKNEPKSKLENPTHRIREMNIVLQII